MYLFKVHLWPPIARASCLARGDESIDICVTQYVRVKNVAPAKILKTTFQKSIQSVRAHYLKILSQRVSVIDQSTRLAAANTGKMTKY